MQTIEIKFNSFNVNYTVYIPFHIIFVELIGLEKDRSLFRFENGISNLKRYKDYEN